MKQPRVGTVTPLRTLLLCRHRQSAGEKSSPELGKKMTGEPVNAVKDLCGSHSPARGDHSVGVCVVRSMRDSDGSHWSLCFDGESLGVPLKEPLQQVCDKLVRPKDARLNDQRSFAVPKVILLSDNVRARSRI